MRIVDTGDYMAALESLVCEGKEVAVKIKGGSMLPFLAGGRDRIFFCKPMEPLRPGDMVFYQRRGGQYVIHRICRVRGEGYYMVGDAQTIVEGPVLREQIFAKVTKAERKGRMIQKGDFWWDFFAGPWVWMRPIRPLFVTIYKAFRT